MGDLLLELVQGFSKGFPRVPRVAVQLLDECQNELILEGLVLTNELPGCSTPRDKFSAVKREELAAIWRGLVLPPSTVGNPTISGPSVINCC
jgi:hypothetical protein